MEPETPRNNPLSLLLPTALILGLALLLSLDVAQPVVEGALANPLEPWLKLIVGYFAAAAEIAAALVIGIAVLRGIFEYFRRGFLPQGEGFDSIETIRLQLGRMLTLGLEFTVASDILRTAVAPTRQDILTLAAIVLLRTLLNYFLEQEIRQAEGRTSVKERSTSKE
ncbi:DUF1622 domain-containing protein [Gloeobacter violaceus]|uniref:Glr0751 protein n=1 Tax=Gloeobacter violaceus (strain ATCC 29082 / PCC 7421) TaxID=251221 RepID=Q7NML4_GLOVI|nr:DUF1622 domain-containing protein [Gloeobacter violaceus]BAC88692.1 glr0751 [Gloeobacter violaceus PCC 7421]